MKILTSKLFRITALLLIVGILVSQTEIIGNLLHPRSAYAVGDLTVTWDGAGTGDTGPMFSASNMAPGDSDTKTITVENDSTSSRPIGIRGIETEDTGNLSDVMTIIISQGNTDLYGGSLGQKTLTQFFQDSQGVSGIPLETLHPGVTRDYTVLVTFLESSGNEYQDKTLTFDLKIGIVVDLPVACESIENLNIQNPIFGTAKSERINGTSSNDLIFALEGSDAVDGKGGNDCIVGGPGSDALNGGDGDDVIFGNDGSDALNGGNGNDQLFGGNGSDGLMGGNGNDTLIGDTGSDGASGGNGTDTCSAEGEISCEL